ncbi:E3 ubiquitin-protein ligase lubel-like [Bradysia coprophila]|uniref:E3 ubiquitin-protein ligase lubel-like n=1 Tax=Bradysia coprophila TaxID=38358 RepID=UPI00187DB88F|nr:E3 ubiquitin-protein ligase lubel-like [Bradysia coprophila]
MSNINNYYCDHCTFLNKPNAKICDMCSKSLKSAIVSTVDEDRDGIQCATCTFVNEPEVEICEMCHHTVFSLEGNIADPEPKPDMPMDECPRQECKLCYEAIGTNYFAMFDCVHIFCHDCAVGYFTNQITQRPILDCICPFCNVPDLHSNADKHEQYFSLLLAILKPILDENIVNVFEKKLTEVALSKEPNFVWCIQCTSGFLKNSHLNMVRCPDCRVRFCFQCKKVWQTQHMNITCEQFAQWQRDNNIQVSQDAIGNYLQKNGIDCPKCKFRYDLSRGGCIHFTCTQCKHEFCFGCSRPFLRQCTVSPYCKNLGLHSHHKRNCLHYLRDKPVAELQGLLEANQINFMVEVSALFTSNKVSDNNNCQIELQIIKGNSIIDTTCREPTKGGQAGLCEKHYKEFLILAITKSNLETNSILTVTNYHELLRFQGIAIPPRTLNQKEDEYKRICEMLVTNNIPLK